MNGLKGKLRDIRDRAIIVDAMCGAILALSITLPPVVANQLEVLAVEAQQATQAELADVSELLSALS